MLRFFISLFIAALLLYAGVRFGVSLGYFHRPSFFNVTLIFLVFSTGLIFMYLWQADKPGFFLQLYLLTMAVKLLAYCAYNLIMILKDKPSAIGNVVFFMIAYFLFTLLEIAFLYGKINRQNTP